VKDYFGAEENAPVTFKYFDRYDLVHFVTVFPIKE
jgi:hypothetical protein